MSHRSLVIGLAVALGIAGVRGIAIGQTPGEGFERRMTRGPADRPIVWYYTPRDSAVVATLSEVVRTYLPEPLVAQSLPPDTIEIAVAPAGVAFVELTGGRAPDWGLAVAFPKIRRIVLRSPRLTGGEHVDPATVLRHELGHVYLDLAVGGSDRLPRWFNEGFSARYADEWRWIDPARLAWGRWTGGATPLSDLDREFAGRTPPTLAYLQSMAAVRSLESRGGPRGLGLLTRRIRAGETFDDALRSTYGLTLQQFYADWGETFDREYGPGLALTDDRLLWVAAALLVVGGFAVRRRRLHREIARRRRAEDQALGPPEDHSLGVEEWERYWEHDDDRWREEDG